MPWDAPVAYLVLALIWITSAVCIAVSIYFYRQNYGTWWLLVALALAMPVVDEIVRPLSHGLPPLPYGEKETQHLSSNLTVTGTTISIYLGPMQPLLAVAFAWAFFADRKKRARIAPTAQT
jgi:hypothetical protein